MKIFLSIFVICSFGVFGERIKNEFSANPDDSVVEDASLPLPMIVTKYGYPVEIHTIQTKDGYLLTVYRIPHGQRQNFSGKKRIPVLLQHGLLTSSYDYIILGPGKALGYVLADNGYDVWLGNNRGTHHSKLHVSMNTTDKEFWDFSWHELGEYDLPAMIDYILQETNEKSLHYVGHSQGTTQFFVFGSLYPEYHKKIRSMHALSPEVFMNDMSSPFVRVLAFFMKPIEKIANIVGMHEFLPQCEFLHMIGMEACVKEYPHIQQLCANVMFLMFGFDEPQLNKTLLPAILGHVPDGASIKQFIHYAQEAKSGKFRQYDYGLVKNLIKYKSTKPPEYELEKIQVPIALYYGSNDWLASTNNIDKLAKILPNLIEKYLVPYDQFNHADFVYATDVYQFVYRRVLENLNKY